MKKKSLFLTVIIFAVLLSAISIFGQKITKIEFKEDDSTYNGGQLYITLNGKKRKIQNDVTDAWIINNGSEVAFSYNEMNRGFEAEGQGLSIYNPKTGKVRPVMSEYTYVTGLTEAKLSNGKTLLLASLGDGGLGASYLAVVDPARGQILSTHSVEILELNGDNLKLAYFKEDDWEAINEERKWSEAKSQSAIPKPTKVTPEKTEILDLKTVIKNKVIYNKTNEELGQEYEKKYSNLTIYLWRPNDKAPQGEDYFLMKVGREFPKTITPLKVSLESLFAGATDYEKETGWESAVFGMKFEGVVLKNGVATIKFSQPKEKNKMPAFAGKMFLESVNGTAKQFPTVRKVEICEVGGTGNAFDVTPQIPKCSK